MRGNDAHGPDKPLTNPLLSKARGLGWKALWLFAPCHWNTGARLSHEQAGWRAGFLEPVLESSRKMSSVSRSSGVRRPAEQPPRLTATPTPPSHTLESDITLYSGHASPPF